VKNLSLRFNYNPCKSTFRKRNIDLPSQNKGYHFPVLWQTHEGKSLFPSVRYFLRHIRPTSLTVLIKLTFSTSSHSETADSKRFYPEYF